MIVKKLKNGITMVKYPIPENKSVEIELYVRLSDDCEDKEGIAHFLEHMHYRQLGDMEQEQLYEKLNKMGVALQGKTYKDMMVFYIKARPQFATQVLSIISNLISTTNWTQEQFELEKEVVLREIEEKNYSYNEHIVDKLIWKKSYLSRSILGETSVVENLTLEEVIAYKKKVFSSDNICVTILGRYDDKEVESEIEKIATIPLQNATEKIKKTGGSVQFKRKPDIKVTKYSSWSDIDVRISFDVDKSKIKENEVIFLSSIMAAGDGSVLMQEMRERRGLVYDIYSYAEEYENNMLLSIEFCTDKENLTECLKLIFDLTANFSSILTQKDIDTNIVFFTDNLWYWEEEKHTLSFELGADFVHRKRLKTIEERINDNQQMNVSRMREVADIIFARENLSISVMGDTRSIRKKDIMSLLNN